MNDKKKQEKPALPLKKRILLIVVISLVSVLVLGGLGVGGHFLYLYFKVPTMTLIGGGEETLAVFSPYAEEGVQSEANGKDLSSLWESDGKVDTDKLGDYTVSYTLRYHFKTYHLTRTVHVTDTEPPRLTLNGEKELTVSAFRLYTEPGCQAADNYDGDLTGDIKTEIVETEKNHYTVTYTVSDSSGNTGKTERTVFINDTVPPIVTLAGNPTPMVEAGAGYTDEGATATDDADGDISDKITVSGGVDAYIPGTYTMTYSATDAFGNVGSVNRTVTVVPRPSDSTSRIYLTFDDGPSSRVTPQVLDILAKYGIKATFFIINFDDSNAALVKRMISEGHTVGIHCYSHDYAQIYASDEAFMSNLYKLRDRIKSVTGYDARVIRFPGGGSNTVSAKYCDGIMTRLAQRVEREGFVYFDWNVGSGDADGNGVPATTLAANVLAGIRPGRNNVVLMHDSNAKQTTADALERMIQGGEAQGYVFLPLTPSTKPVHHGINN